MQPQGLCDLGCRLLRRRPLVEGPGIHLPRCLTTLDLVSLGVGGTLGAGAYVLAGDVVRDQAGPGIVFSFLVATLPCLLSGLCYAELGAHVPYSGSAYVSSYVTVGQLLAFVTGWNLILSYVLGAASVARAWSAAFDGLISGYAEQGLGTRISLHAPQVLAAHADFVALGVVLLLTVLLAAGMRESVLLTRLFAGVNLLVLAFVTVAGFIKGNLRNWELMAHDYLLAESRLNGTHSLGAFGEGGFFPFGMAGCWDDGTAGCLCPLSAPLSAPTGEEAHSPRLAIPLSLVVSLFVCFMMYSGLSAALTLLTPYYLIRPERALFEAFIHVGWTPFSYVVAVGTLCALSSSLLGAMLSMPRVIFAMAEDGLLFRGLAWVHAGTNIPVLATVVSGVIAACMAFLFELIDLVDLTCIGTLVACSLVAFSVLVLRFQPDEDSGSSKENTRVESQETQAECDVISADPAPQTGCLRLGWALCVPGNATPSAGSGRLVYLCAMVLVLLLIGLGLVLAWWPDRLFSGDLACVVGVSLLLLLTSGALGVIWRQPQNPAPLHFKVPGVPLLPALSIVMNVCLMLQMSPATWTRLAVWMLVGLAMYFGYGIWHSLEEQEQEQ
uniref:Cationic amino acid transporter C-terminal domain-containing protein n=1 Tax=Cavia porcellus TaxID=10141 RepID=H0W9E0_CAVPO